jgi:hypothetical protein
LLEANFRMEHAEGGGEDDARIGKVLRRKGDQEIDIVSLAVKLRFNLSQSAKIEAKIIFLSAHDDRRTRHSGIPQRVCNLAISHSSPIKKPPGGGVEF